MVIFSKLQKQRVIAGYKVTPLFFSKNYENNNSIIKSYPLIFNENFENNESKMVFPQEQGGRGPALVENSTKKLCFFNPSLKPFLKLNKNRFGGISNIFSSVATPCL